MKAVRQTPVIHAEGVKWRDARDHQERSCLQFLGYAEVPTGFVKSGFTLGLTRQVRVPLRCGVVQEVVMERILLPVDGSRSSIRAARHAAKLARALGADEVCVLNIQPAMSGWQVHGLSRDLVANRCAGLAAHRDSRCRHKHCSALGVPPIPTLAGRKANRASRCRSSGQPKLVPRCKASVRARSGT